MSESTLWDVTIPIENKPGQMARIIEALESAHVPFEGMSCYGTGTKGEIHVLVGDKAKTATAVEKAGFTVTRQQEAYCEEMKNYTDVIGRYARALATANVNVEATYLASHNRFVVVCDDPARARSTWTALAALARN